MHAEKAQSVEERERELAGIASGALVGAVVAVLQVKYKAPDMVIGTSLNLLINGATTFLLYVIFGFTEMSPFILLAIGLVSLYFLQIILHKYYLKKYNIDPNYSKFMTEDHKKE